MAEASERVVIISYDAATGGFASNPNPIRLGPGSHKLYFALQTVNRGDADAAIFRQVYEDNLLKAASRVGTCDQLWTATLVNEPAVAREVTYRYTVRIAYAGVEHSHDPSVVLQPPPTPPPRPTA